MTGGARSGGLRKPDQLLSADHGAPHAMGNIPSLLALH